MTHSWGCFSKSARRTSYQACQLAERKRREKRVRKKSSQRFLGRAAEFSGSHTELHLFTPPSGSCFHIMAGRLKRSHACPVARLEPRLALLCKHSACFSGNCFASLVGAARLLPSAMARSGLIGFAMGASERRYSLSRGMCPRRAVTALSLFSLFTFPPLASADQCVAPRMLEVVV